MKLVSYAPERGITKNAEPYKIFSQLIQEGTFSDSELTELENLIKSRK